MGLGPDMKWAGVFRPFGPTEIYIFKYYINSISLYFSDAKWLIKILHSCSTKFVELCRFFFFFWEKVYRHKKIYKILHIC